MKAAELVWQVLASGPATQAVAQRMMQNITRSACGDASRLGNTAWNAYSFNIDYRTGWTDPSLVKFLLVVALKQQSEAASIDRGSHHDVKWH